MKRSQKMQLSPLKHSIIAISQFPELRRMLLEIKKMPYLQNRQLFQQVTDNWIFELPDIFEEAKSIILVAVPGYKGKITCQLPHKQKDIFLPPSYFQVDEGVEAAESYVRSEVFHGEKHRLMISNPFFPLKLLAVASGLGRYGKNNLAFVEGMGSYAAFISFLTDYECEPTPLRPLQMMEECSGCERCLNACPNSCIEDDHFVLNSDRCLTYINRGMDAFPEWINADTHHMLMGCIQCLESCPQNSAQSLNLYDLGVLTEAETLALMDLNTDQEAQQQAIQKLCIRTEGILSVFLPAVSRNLRLLLQ